MGEGGRRPGEGNGVISSPFPISKWYGSDHHETYCNVVGASKHFVGDDALVGQPTRHTRLRRATLRALSPEDPHPPPGSRRSHSVAGKRLAQGRSLAYGV